MRARPLVGLFVRRSWRAFCGCAHDDLVLRVQDTLSGMERAFDRTKATPTGAERWVFGAEEATRFSLDDRAFTVTVTSVTCDPLLRAALRIGTSGASRERYADRAAIVDIRPVVAAERAEIASFVAALAADLERPPWKIDHPRFRFAPLLRLKVRLLWEYWLAADRRSARTSRPDSAHQREVAPMRDAE